MSDQETPSRDIGAIFKQIFGGLLVLFGGGCVVVWLPSISYLADDAFWFLAPGLVALALGVAVLRQGFGIIFGGLLMLFGLGGVGLGLVGVRVGDVDLYRNGLAIGLASLILGVWLLLKALRQRRNDTRED